MAAEKVMCQHVCTIEIFKMVKMSAVQPLLATVVVDYYHSGSSETILKTTIKHLVFKHLTVDKVLKSKQHILEETLKRKDTFLWDSKKKKVLKNGWLNLLLWRTKQLLWF